MKRVQRTTVALILAVILTLSGCLTVFAGEGTVPETTESVSTEAGEITEPTSESVDEQITESASETGEESAGDQSGGNQCEESDSPEGKNQKQEDNGSVEQENTEETESPEEESSEETTETTPPLTGDLLGAGTENNYLTFTAEEANSSVTFNYASGSDVMYSTDGGTNWTDYTKGTEMSLANAGDSISFKGTSVTTDSSNHFAMTGKIAASGDVTSLTNGVGGDCTLEERCYQDMFFGCAELTKAPNLPATTLALGCYEYMFQGCTRITKTPDILATNLASGCYQYMFSGCTGLTEATDLPATTLTQYCYYSMFSGCTSLTKAPNLPATTLAKGCYSSMFFGCKNLTEAPNLPATTLVQDCYSHMFNGCESLTKVSDLPATTLADYCYAYMFNGCTGIKLSETQVDNYTLAWSLPSEATTSTGWNTNMFAGTGGTFTGNPVIESTYYVWSETSSSEKGLTDFYIEDIEIIEGTNGYSSSQYVDGEYKYYWYYQPTNSSKLEVTVTYDGETYSGSLSSLSSWLCNKTGTWPSYSSNTPQSYTSQWTVGNTYQASVTMLGKTAIYNVSIVENPLTAFTVEDVEIVEGSCGYASSYYDNGEQKYYWYYQLSGINPKATVTYAGETFTGTITQITSWLRDKTGEAVYLTENLSQSYTTPWKAGNTYQASLTVLGQTASFNVKITENPLTAITIEDIEIPEGTCGYQSSSYVDGEYKYYWNYNPLNSGKFQMSVTYGGETYSGNWTQVYKWLENKTGKSYLSCSTYPYQSYSSKWTAGNTYSATLAVLGKIVEFNVTITDSPLASFIVDDLEVEEGTLGYVDGQSPNTYWRYDVTVASWIASKLNGVMVYNGKMYMGTMEELRDMLEDFTGNSVSFSVKADDAQSYENQWAVGDVHKATVTFGGKTAEFNVKITPSKLTSIEVDDLEISEYEGSASNRSYCYYNLYNNKNLNITVTYDGEIYSGTYNEIKEILNGKMALDTEIDLYTDQSSSNPWTPGNTYQATLRIGKQQATFNVSVTKGEIELISIEDLTVEAIGKGLPIGRTCYSYTFNPYVTYSYNGTVCTAYADEIEKKTGVSFYYDTYSENGSSNWVEGNTYSVKAWLGGHNATFNVTIGESQIDRVECADMTIQKSGSYLLTPKITLYKKNGETMESNDGGIYYNNYNASFVIDSYSEPMSTWQAGGTYTVYGSILGFDCSFNVTVDDTKYVRLDISGDDELVLTLTDSNRNKTNWTIDSITAGTGHVLSDFMAKDATIYCTMTSGERTFENVAVSYLSDGGCAGIVQNVSITWDGLTSNELTENDWLKANLIGQFSAFHQIAQYNYGLSDGDEIHDFNGKITTDNIDSVMQMAAFFVATETYYVDNTYTKAEMEALIKKTFGLEVDLNDYEVVDGDGNVTVDYAIATLSIGKTGLIKGNDTWTLTYDWQNASTFRLVIDSNGYVKSFGYGSGSNEHTSHTLRKVNAKEATFTSDGNYEYWYCTECEKCFSDAYGKTEVEKESRIIPAKEWKRTLRLGLKGDDVKAVQEYLISHGYLDGEASGTYDWETYAAVTMFQAQNGLEDPDGSVGERTINKIRNVSTDFESFKKGSYGTAVKAMQIRLVELGYLSATPDGDFGGMSETALKKFQLLNRLPITGVADAETLRKLYSSSALSFRTMNTGMRGDDVLAIQQYLYDLGYLTATPDGEYGNYTKAAVTAFQAANGLYEVDGQCGNWTMGVLASGESIPFAGFAKGDSSIAVKVMQKYLVDLGYLSATPDGDFGGMSETALMKFQLTSGLKVTGIADQETLYKLYHVSAVRQRTFAVGSYGSDVKYVQQALVDLGYLTATPDGDYGNMSKAAVRKFQMDHRLPEEQVDGMVGNWTLGEIVKALAEL